MVTINEIARRLAQNRWIDVMQPPEKARYDVPAEIAKLVREHAEARGLHCSPEEISRAVTEEIARVRQRLGPPIPGAAIVPGN